MDKSEAYTKAMKYYRRWTLGLIPVTMIIPEMVAKRQLKYMNDEIKNNGE